MKTVSGAVVSSKPVSLSKAAKILSKFALADNGASPAYAAYLKRASDSFNELVQFHRELRGSGSERKSKKHRSGDHVVEKPVDSITNHSEDGGKEDSIGRRKKDSKEKKAGNVEKEDEVGLVNGHDSKKQKKMNEIQGKLDLVSVDDSRESRRIKKELKKELKKIKKEAIEGGRSNGTVEDQGNGGETKVEDENGGKRSKKRKSEEMADEEAFGLAEKQVHEKRKKKGRNESDA